MEKRSPEEVALSMLRAGQGERPEWVATHVITALRNAGFIKKPELDQEFHETLHDFINLGWKLSELWPAWLTGPDRYPAYLPSFDEFLDEFERKVLGSE